MRSHRCRAGRALPGHPGRPPQWCGTCAGQLLADLVAYGQIVTVTAISAFPGQAGEREDVIELDGEAGVADMPWTVDLAIEVLRYARPCLRELTGEGAALHDRDAQRGGADRGGPPTSPLGSAPGQALAAPR